MTPAEQNTGIEMTQEEVQEFVVEARDLLDTAETDLLALDKGEPFQSHYDSTFRVFHSLKGGAGMLGLLALQAHMHKLENILSATKSRGSMTKAEISLFLRGVDGARKILDGESIEFVYDIESATTKPQSEAKASTPPVAPAPQKSEPAEPRQKSIGPDTASQGTIFIVDDEPDILDILQSILVSAKFEVRCFSDASILLQEVKKSPPDAVFTDMKMPGLTGMDVLKGVKQVDQDIPVVFISGYLTKDLLLEALASGVHAAVEKPFNESNVLTIAHNAIVLSQTTKLLTQSVNLVMYQFSDLEKFLKAQGNEDVRKTIRAELDQLMRQKRALREAKKSSKT